MVLNTLLKAGVVIKIPELVIYYTIVNIALFLLMMIDKTKAKKKSRRVPEKTLLFWGIIGGAVGGLLGSKVFHHKTQKKYFACIYTISVIAHIILLIYLFYF